ncbi:rhodanese-like domain-containing protein [Thiomonas sp.]|jgi:rhodanese-related sulfurtransferase|uniref:rhodanese-like domain-containing protein n=1 Tax=Thiomonas sp. TaxID=2047785 RepID=UPI00262E08CF|nr:rhodanese-like domain-containing protein [Thiomonas sp.]
MIKQLSVRELADKIHAATGPITDWQFLDVREPWEFQMAAIRHPHCPVVHIPMSIVPLRQNELDQSKPLVVICRSGNRSMMVARFLEQNGFGEIYNLNGGMTAWSREIDPSVPLY